MWTQSSGRSVTSCWFLVPACPFIKEQAPPELCHSAAGWRQQLFRDSWSPEEFLPPPRGVRLQGVCWAPEQCFGFGGRLKFATSFIFLLWLLCCLGCQGQESVGVVPPHLPLQSPVPRGWDVCCLTSALRKCFGLLWDTSCSLTLWLQSLSLL